MLDKANNFEINLESYEALKVKLTDNELDFLAEYHKIQRYSVNALRISTRYHNNRHCFVNESGRA